MFLSMKAYGALGIVLVLSFLALAAPAGSGGPAPQDRKEPAVTFYVA